MKFVALAILSVLGVAGAVLLNQTGSIGDELTQLSTAVAEVESTIPELQVADSLLFEQISSARDELAGLMSELATLSSSLEVRAETAVELQMATDLASLGSWRDEHQRHLGTLGNRLDDLAESVANSIEPENGSNTITEAIHSLEQAVVDLACDVVSLSLLLEELRESAPSSPSHEEIELNRNIDDMLEALPQYFNDNLDRLSNGLGLDDWQTNNLRMHFNDVEVEISEVFTAYQEGEIDLDEFRQNFWDTYFDIEMRLNETLDEDQLELALERRSELLTHWGLWLLGLIGGGTQGESIDTPIFE